jgi:hypothetical protein
MCNNKNTLTKKKNQKTLQKYLFRNKTSDSRQRRPDPRPPWVFCFLFLQGFEIIRIFVFLRDKMGTLQIF